MVSQTYLTTEHTRPLTLPRLTPDLVKHLNFINSQFESYWIYLLCSEELNEASTWLLIPNKRLQN